MNHKDDIVQIIQTRFMRGKSFDLQPGDSFLDSGVLDSIGMIELVGLLEKRFAIHVEDDELVPENLDSVEAISGYLERKGAGA